MSIIHRLSFLFLLVVFSPIIMLQAATYHVAPTGVDTADGSEATPLASLEAAVAKAVDGDTILLHDGTYRRTSATPLVIDKAIVVESVNGADAVTLTPTDEVPSEGIKVTHENAVVRGLTLLGFNTKTYNGASGLYLSKGSASGCKILRCYAKDAKAAGAVVRDGARLSDSLIAFCSLPNGGTDRRGAGLCVWDGVVERCEIVSNKAPYGAGVVMESAGSVVRDCQIRDNTVSRDYFAEDLFRNLGCGGGVYQLNGLLERCLITDNIAGKHAGVYAEKGIVRNCLVTGNSADKGTCGGLFSKQAVLQNVTVIGNQAVCGGGIAFLAEGGMATNLLVYVWDGRFPMAEQVSVSPSAKVGSSAFPVSVPGTGNVVLTLGDIDMATLRPLASSPAATGADCSEVYSDDLEGKTRPASFGMGALRPFSGPESVLIVSADKNEGVLPLTVRFSASFQGAAAEDCEWVFGDGETARGATVTHVFAKAGEFSVKATLPDGTVALYPVRTGPAVVYVAPDGANVSPYDSPEKAARSIQDAIATVYSSAELQGEVRVAPGVYSAPAEDLAKTWSPMVTLAKNVRLIGLGATREDVLLDASRKRQVMEIAHPEAVVENLTMANGRYDNNSWYAVGNLMFLSGTVRNCLIRDGYGNYAGNIAMGDGRLLDCEVRGGTLNISGSDRPSGGVNVFGSALVENCLIHDNRGGLGGGLFCSPSAAKAIIRHCEIIGNTEAGNGGGGVALRAGLLDGSVVSNNLSFKNGGGVTIYGSKATLRNCLIVNNESRGAKYGFGFRDSGSGGNVSIKEGVIENCTIYGGKAMTAGGQDVYQIGGKIRNTIIASRPDSLAEQSVEKTGGTLTTSIVPVAGLGDTAICADPMLEGPQIGKFELLFGSPCLDRGEPIPEVTSDLLGRERPIGDGYDIGCFEMDFASAFAASFSTDNTTGTDSLDARFTAQTKNGVEPITYTWDFGDGTIESTTTPEASHSFGRGAFDVSMTARDSAGKVVKTVRTSYITVNARVVYVSHDGTADWPYDTWEKSTPVIQNAIDAVQGEPGKPGVVYVADGTYGVRNETDPFIAILQRPIHVIGTNGGHRAVLDSVRYSGRRNALVDHPEALLANVACANGEFKAAGHGAGIWMESGVCSNVAVYNCMGFEGGLTIHGGLFTDGVISNCPNMTHDGFDRLGGGACVYGGVVQRSLITNCVNGAGGAVYLNGPDAVVRDSLLLGCDNYREAPVYIEKGLVERCLIQGNRNRQENSQRRLISAVLATGPASVIRNCLVITNTGILKNGDQYAVVIEDGAQAVNNVVSGNIHGKTLAVQGVLNVGGIVMNTIADALTTTGEGVSKANFTGADPGFRDAAKGDYSLRTSSPCLNAGDNEYWLTVEKPVDYAGKPRIRLGKVDIGALEFDGSLGTMLFIR